jgi:hypothetical protein
VKGGAAKVFISYRREETAGHSGRLYDVMSSRFGDSHVFMDVDIPPGVDFVNQITEAVSKCHVLLVIMGPHWATISNGAPLPRIFDPGDFVRLEVETGLKRSDVAVIPVLVGGAKMPAPEAMPAPLRPLTRRNAIELSDTRWRYDVDRLLGALDTLLAHTSAVHRVPSPPPPRPVAPQPLPPPLPPARSAEPRGYNGPMLAVTTTLAAGAAAIVARAGANRLRWEGGEEHATMPVVLEGLTWAIVGAVVAIWITAWVRRRALGVGTLLLGALVGALGGAASAAIYFVPKRELSSPPADRIQEWLTVVSVAVLGALIGALIGRVWRRNGSAAVSAGLLAGAVVGLIIKGDVGSNALQRISHALLEAVVIVGVATVTQALLDAREPGVARVPT